MLSLFRRRKGRHQLGAAVTSIPAALPPVARAVPAPPRASTPVAPPEPAAAPAPEPAPVVRAPEPVLVVSGPRVELGFRDGSRASLDPSSEQARALEGIAAVLTRRD